MKSAKGMAIWISSGGVGIEGIMSKKELLFLGKGSAAV